MFITASHCGQHPTPQGLPKIGVLPAWKLVKNLRFFMSERLGGKREDEQT